MSGIWALRIQCILSTPLYLMSLVTNYFFLANWEIGVLYYDKIFDPTGKSNLKYKKKTSYRNFIISRFPFGNSEVKNLSLGLDFEKIEILKKLKTSFL